MIVNEQLAELPLPSAKVYVTVVVPTGNELPELWVLPVRVTVPERSVAVASAKFTAREAVPTSTVPAMFDGQVTVGGVVSTIQESKGETET